jgi:hypothetical protein
MRCGLFLASSIERDIRRCGFNRVTVASGLRPPRSWVVGLAWVLALLASPSARADITFYDLFKVIAYDQTSNAQPTTPSEYFGNVGVSASSPADLTGGQVTSTSPLSPMTLTGSNGNFSFSTPGLSSKAALDTDLPNGTTYTYTLSGGNFGGQSATLSTPSSDAYASAVPYFTNNAFTALQNVNAHSAITLTWNAFTAPTGVNTPLIFIGISEVSTGQSVFGISGDNTITSTTVAANTLLPGTQYDLDIVYSARLQTPNAGFTDATSFTAYDLRTDLVFTTAVPEPSSILLLGAGAAWLAWTRLRRRARRVVVGGG